MRCLSVLLLGSSVLSLLMQPPAVAAETDAVPTEVIRAQGFWPQAQQLLQAQILLVNRIERAVAEPDPNQVRAARGQLTLQTAAVDRFLKSQYPLPNLLCAPTRIRVGNTEEPFTVGSGLSQSQGTVYCNLYQSTQKLASLGDLLDRRLFMLASIAEVKPLRVVGEQQPLSLPGTPTQSPNLGKPATYRYGTAPTLPTEKPLVIGQATKTAIADYVPPISPAIAPPPEVAPVLQSIKQLLTRTQSAFPNAASFSAPTRQVEALDQYAYGLYPKERQLYAKFLEQPNTGIARVLLSEAYRPQPSALQNRLEPTVAERFPFVPLVQSEAKFTPRFLLEIENGRFQLVQSGLNYGFLAPMGDVPIEALQPTLPTQQVELAPDLRQFFLTYVPPNQLDAIQTDRRRFLSGKVNNLALNQLLMSQAPISLNQTYLMRSLQFQMPEIVMSREPVSRRDRRYLDLLLETPSSDHLLAFRPVIRHSDGTYTVLWRVLQQFPDPQIQDLDKYVNLD
ncbi:hypothetical protein H6F90_05645 [Trichocoleus sp. FACHB-591]|uniref:hypothetical protein n=1 Tax=Trichocoleus sp. FACHB-591 TaxID=2692872 RepID=UPI0016894A59|nr:hypothetical protein [Trichocoleus sp. FACHB-591]MBD2094633.1 hypothetical protein [Trichocoleus sp. FACHB-591]